MSEFQLHQDALLYSSRFNENSLEMFARWKSDFEACLRGDSAPSPKLGSMFKDISDYIRSTESRFLFFGLDTLAKETLVSGTAFGRKVFLKLKQGVSVMVRLYGLPDVITEPVFVLDLFVLAFTTTYPKATRLALVHLFTPDGKTHAQLTSGSDAYNVWPTVPDEQGRDICVLQLWGLLQFSMVPRHPIKGVLGVKCAGWGYDHGIAATTLSHQLGLQEEFDFESATVIEIDE
jgi:hypothetical protein